ncbi:putative thymidine kinase [Pseudomonas phage OBP]|uniref:thymidine kinase n=1 Tax=Pseudomonas phage OBP TaxID=1124849 RepID=UPI000240D5DD|nr:thymidine kinase [Pseudomonas phage OBP]AEV89686.1 putative thymidine kinase [Pseudomonas phage OBP]
MASLYFYFSTMNAGKSTGLLQANYNYGERELGTLVMKPGIDDRENGAIIKSRIGLESPCLMFGKDENLYDLVYDRIKAGEEINCVLIDEAQFMEPIQVTQLGMVVDCLKVPVMCYGLRTDFRGELFPGSAKLMAIANDMFEVRTICWCGKRAQQVLRLDDQGKVIREGDVVVTGGNERYVSVCREHHRLGIIRKASKVKQIHFHEN